MSIVDVVTDSFPLSTLLSHLWGAPVFGCFSFLVCHTASDRQRLSKANLHISLVPNPVGGWPQPAVNAAKIPLSPSGHVQVLSESQHARQPPISDFGLPPGAVIRLEQFLSCCKLLLFTFAPGRIFHHWLDATINVHLLLMLPSG